VTDVKENGAEDDHAEKDSQSTGQPAIKKDRCHNSHALQPDESPLIMKRRPRIPFTQLVDPENTSDENHQNCQTDKRHEEFEPRIEPPTRHFPNSDVVGVAESVLDREGDEGEDDGDLQRETGEAKVDACGGRAVGLR